MIDFTNDEMNLLCFHGTEAASRAGHIAALRRMRAELEPDETELLALTDSTIAKLTAMTEEEYAGLEFFPDFGEDGEYGE